MQTLVADLEMPTLDHLFRFGANSSNVSVKYANTRTDSNSYISLFWDQEVFSLELLTVFEFASLLKILELEENENLYIDAVVLGQALFLFKRSLSKWFLYAFIQVDRWHWGKHRLF